MATTMGTIAKSAASLQRRNPQWMKSLIGGCVKPSRCFSKKPEKPNKKEGDGGPKMVRVQPDDERCYMFELLEKVGVPKKQSEMIVANLLFADSRGILTHGLARLPMYIKELQTGGTCPNAMPKVVQETDATALVEGNNAFGAVVGTVSMQTAIKKAKACGFGWVSARGSNHFGVNSFYTLMAGKEGLIGIAGTNSTPLMVAPGGKTSLFGTNPLSISVGNKPCYTFCLDFSMTKVARGKIEVNRVKGLKIPNDWALDKSGNPTEDPQKALEADLLLPAGDYKGFGLGAMVDIMGGVLSGAKFSSKILSWNVAQTEAFDLGQIFIAINPCMFADNFEERLKDFMDMIRKSQPLNPKSPILVPGDIEEKFQRDTEKIGLPFPENLMTIVNDLAKSVGASPLEFKPAK